jgi:5-formyltetrahydrofolate cyclo-ligase
MDAKQLLRSRHISARAARSRAELAAAEARLAEHGLGAWGRASRVVAYAAVGDEPPTHALLDQLRAAGVTVVLPVIAGTGLDWAPYEDWDRLAAGPFRLLQPGGPALTDDVLATADVVLVPALAVDSQGNRLGRGRGYYDRALTGVEPERVVAVVFDDEVVDAVPHQPHDRPVGGVLTPSGVRRLGR